MDEFNKNDEFLNTVEDNFNAVNSTDSVEPVVENKEKKVKVQTPIIIAACILVAVVLGFFCFKLFFNNSLVGTWTVKTDASADESADSEEPAIYYTFNNDHTASLAVGSMKVNGEWWYADSNGATSDQASDTMVVSISYLFNGVYQFEVSGNTFTGKTLTLKSGEGQEYTLESKSMPEPDLRPVENHKVDEKLVGEWKNDEVNISYTFNSDGSCVINQMDTLIIDGVYSAADGKIDIKYIAQSEANTSVEYEINDSSIIISGLEYKKVNY